MTAGPPSASGSGRRALHVGDDWTVFVDRDGVINRRVVGDYVRSTAQLELLPGSIDALARLSRAAAHVIVVTNQAGIGKGLLTVDDFERVNGVIIDAVVATGGHLDAVLHCPHVPADACRCRKPGPGLAEQADERFGDIDHARSVMIGDSAGDIRFGADLGMATVLVTGTGGDHDGAPEPDLRADDLAGAADLLLDVGMR
jgi:D-glycero-D-manno-heptose 1,7-bisphosphate phosphatase